MATDLIRRPWQRRQSIKTFLFWILAALYSITSDAHSLASFVRLSLTSRHHAELHYKDRIVWCVRRGAGGGVNANIMQTVQANVSLFYLILLSLSFRMSKKYSSAFIYGTQPYTYCCALQLIHQLQKTHR